MVPPNRLLFTQKGNPASRLAGALNQVRAWKTYVENNCGMVLRELSKFTEKAELLWGRKSEILCNAGLPLHHPDVCRMLEHGDHPFIHALNKALERAELLLA
jgi:hypothetical protein